MNSLSDYQPANGRYDRMPYKYCGKSGLQLPLISLGLWHNFGSVDDLKIATDINAGGFEGKFDCKWEMQDANGENCFPNYTWDFNIQISVTFMEVDS